MKGNCLYNTMNTKIILIRHAQSIKNLKDIHGGKGERLTTLGKKQASDLADRLLKIGISCDNAIIAAPSNIQTKETEKIISNLLSLPRCDISDFRPLYLGVVHGLSNEVVTNKYPQISDLLFLWRNKELEIYDLKIPQMENVFEFYNRGLKILNKLSKGKYNIFVATNSLYILLLNILFGNTCMKGGGYKHFDIPNCGLTMFNETSNGQFVLDIEHTDVEDVLLYRK